MQKFYFNQKSLEIKLARKVRPSFKKTLTKEI